jgi:MarR family transcriptional regulator, organic hydroperoxide resistance regulator
MTECGYQSCLYFTVNRLARLLSKLADDIFKPTGLSPAHAFALMQINRNPQMNQCQLAKTLALAPSTLTRFVDQLEHKGLVTRHLEGKQSLLVSTPKGKGLQKSMEQAWHKLHMVYTETLGEKIGQELPKVLNQAGLKLEKKV